MQTIDLMQNNFKIPPLVYMVQNDTGRTLKMNIRDNTLEAGDTAEVAINRSDGSYYTISATRVIGENAFSADMTQALTQPGLTKCQLKVTSSSLVVSTYMFGISVEASTDGVPTEQLGYTVQDIINAAAEIMNTGLSDAVKQALLQIAAKAVYVDDGGPQYYAELEEALNPTRTLTSIVAVYTQSGTVYTTDSLDSLKPDLVVTANYSDGSTATVTGYTLSGELTAGTSTITVSYDGQSDTFTVTVTAPVRYVFYDYIYATNTTETNNYVDTGLTEKWGAYSCEFEAMNSNNLATATSIFGANNSSTASKSNVLWYARASKGGFSSYYLGQAKQLNTVPGDTRAVCKYVFVDGGQSYLEYNGTTVAVATESASSLSVLSNTMVLAGGWTFAGNTKVGLRSDRLVKLGYIKFTDPANGDAVVHHFKPAHDTQEDKVGYYDTVTDTFYPAKTGAALSLGNWT